MQELLRESYCSGQYRYCIEYPADWKLTQLGSGKVLIVANIPQVNVAIDEPFQLKAGQSLGEYVSGFAHFISTAVDNYELVSLVGVDGGNYRLEYYWALAGLKVHMMCYFVVHGGLVYMIGFSAPEKVYEFYVSAFEYIYSSFTFQ